MKVQRMTFFFKINLISIIDIINVISLNFLIKIQFNIILFNENFLESKGSKFDSRKYDF